MNILYHGWLYESISNGIIAYHGTNSQFDFFDGSHTKNGDALGTGYYFTLNPEVAKLYGSRIIKVNLNLNKLLDFDNMNQLELEELNEYYSNKIDQARYAGHGQLNRIDVTEMDRSSISSKYQELKELTKDYYHDRAKAELTEDSGRIYIQWMSFKLTNSDELFRYLQDSQNFKSLRDLGYDSFKRGDVIVVWDSSKIKIISDK